MATKSIAFHDKNVLPGHRTLIRNMVQSMECTLQEIETEILNEKAIIFTVTSNTWYDLAEAFYFIGGILPYQAFPPVPLPEYFKADELLEAF